jgi:hypothetical protein
MFANEPCAADAATTAAVAVAAVADGRDKAVHILFDEMGVSAS